MTRLSMSVARETLSFATPFRISGYVFENTHVVLVTLDDGVHQGRGEACGVYYLGDNADHVVATLEEFRSVIEAGPSRDDLRWQLPAGGARNAVDCALWALESARRGLPVWRLAGMDPPKPLVTTFTIGADDPEVSAAKARSFAGARALKLKLAGEFDSDVERVRAVRAARPDVWLGVDANQGYVRSQLEQLLPALVDAGVSLLEQPLPRGQEADLQGFESPIPIAADESVLRLVDVAGLVGRFDVVNIKLDKCGGLTEGLAMAAEARRLGLDVMVGCMVGSSLAMAPAFVLGQLCDIVDLDGPTFLTQDRTPSVTYEAGTIWAGEDVWESRGRAAA
jgi:L-alanine-DL-glutamate epimerase-like enolase superfamily enzyme